MWMFGGSSVSRSGVPDGVQYSTSPAADITGSPANDSDEAVAGSAKGSRTQPSIHIEVNWQLLWLITAGLVKCVAWHNNTALFLSLWPDWFWGLFTVLSSTLKWLELKSADISRSGICGALSASTGTAILCFPNKQQEPSVCILSCQTWIPAFTPVKWPEDRMVTNMQNVLTVAQFIFLNVPLILYCFMALSDVFYHAFWTTMLHAHEYVSF